MRKNFVCRAQYLRNHSSYDHHLFFVAQVQNDDIFRCFFHFFKFWFSVLGCYGVEGKRAKNGPKWQKNSNSVSQEPHNCGFWYTCVTFFFFFFLIFSKFWFLRFFKAHQEMPKGTSQVCPTFFSCVWFFKYNRSNLSESVLWKTCSYNLANFTGKHLCWSHFSKKIILLKEESLF